MAWAFGANLNSLGSRRPQSIKLKRTKVHAFCMYINNNNPNIINLTSRCIGNRNYCMKKYFYLFLSLFAVILFSCDQNTPSDPSNTTDPNNPSNPTDSSDISNPSIVSKVKYTKETASWQTYQNTENGTILDIELNIVTKIVYERGSETKYLKSVSNYVNDELKSKTTYQNESDRDYYWVSYPSSSESSKDTTIWYDEARTKYKEIRNKTYRSVYEYDRQHNDRPLSIKTYYYQNNLWSETTYNYDGLFQYGESKSYNNTGKIISLLRSTGEFLDDSYTCQKFYETETYIYLSETQSYRSASSYTRSEWNDNLLIKEVYNNETFDQNGNRLGTSTRTYTYTWQDELNCTFDTEFYLDNILWTRHSGYSQSTY